MLQSIAKLIRFCFLSLLFIAGVALCVENRGSIELTFYPFPYVGTMPLYIFGIAMLVIGLLLGWMLKHMSTLSLRRAHKDSGKRVAALENELTALRSEQLIKPVAIARR